MSEKVRLIEIAFPVGVDLPPGFDRALSALVGMVCDKYQQDNPERVMWPASAGSRPRWDHGEIAGFDDDVYVIGCEEREDYHGSNPFNPKRDEIRSRIAAERAVREAQRLDKRPGAVGVHREPGNPNALTVVFDREPSDDDLRALHDGLRK